MGYNFCLASLLVTLLLGSVEVSTGQEEPLVTAPAGTFRGKVLTSPSGVRYASYRGIPYALPPTGERRFAKPEPYPAIQGIYEALDFGPFCVQPGNGQVVGQEDCLFLNVYLPLQEETTEQKKDLKSVYVFIHGGGLIIGCSDLYVPGDLVTRGDIVVVTMNYRLGVLGFLHGNSSSLPGNQGYWDQLLALRWVKDNIRAFGGDPDDVTLSGESAGSMSTSVWSISPLGKGLFNKAIFLSGISFRFPSPPRTSNVLLEMINKKFPCGIKSLPGNEESLVACLKQQKAEEFIIEFSLQIFYDFTSTEDEIVPRSMFELIEDKEYLRNVGFFDRDYILSFTKDDGYIFTNSPFGKVDTSSIDSGARGLSKAILMPEDMAEFLITEYKKIYEELEISLMKIASDDFFVKGIFRFLEVFAKNPRQVVRARKAYMMSFDHSPKYMPNQYMAHALDLTYLFDLHSNFMETVYFIKLNESFHEEDFQLKKEFIDVVVAFVKTGNPNNFLKNKRNVEWPPFDQDKKSYLSFSLDPSVHQDVLANRRHIWETLLPKWLQENRQQDNRQEL